MGGDGGHDKIDRVITSSISKKDYRDDGAAYGDQGLGVDPGG